MSGVEASDIEEVHVGAEESSVEGTGIPEEGVAVTSVERSAGSGVLGAALHFLITMHSFSAFFSFLDFLGTSFDGEAGRFGVFVFFFFGLGFSGVSLALIISAIFSYMLCVPSSNFNKASMGSFDNTMCSLHVP